MRTIFVNLQVKNLDESRAFWSELGFSFNDQYCDAASISVSLDGFIADLNRLGYGLRREAVRP